MAEMEVGITVRVGMIVHAFNPSIVCSTWRVPGQSSQNYLMSLCYYNTHTHTKELHRTDRMKISYTFVIVGVKGKEKIKNPRFSGTGNKVQQGECAPTASQIMSGTPLKRWMKQVVLPEIPAHLRQDSRLKLTGQQAASERQTSTGGRRAPTPAKLSMRMCTCSHTYPMQ